MLEKLHSKGFVSWAVTSHALQITKDGLCKFVEPVMRGFLEKDFDSEHFGEFIKKIVHGEKEKRLWYGYKNKKGSLREWKFEENDTVYQQMFEHLLRNYTNSFSRAINWQCHGSEDISPESHWWILSKIYIPEANIGSTGPDQVDTLALLSLMANCKQFEEEYISVKKLIKRRHLLMHTSSTTLDEEQMEAAFDDMKKLLNQKRIKETCSETLRKIEELQDERYIILKTSREIETMFENGLALKREELKCDLRRKITGVGSTQIELFLKQTEKVIENVVMEKGKRAGEEEARQKLEETAAKVHELTKEISSLKEKLELEREKYRKALEEIEELRRKLAATKSTQNTSNDDSFMSHVVTGATAGGTVGSVGGIVGSVVGGAGGAVTGAAIGIVRAFSSRR